MVKWKAIGGYRLWSLPGRAQRILPQSQKPIIQGKKGHLIKTKDRKEVPRYALRILGRNIATARKKANLSQVELGEACGWSYAQTRVSDYERGKREPGETDLQIMASVLGVTIADLVQGAEDPYEKRFMDKLSRLDSERRRQIEDAVDAFLITADQLTPSEKEI